jgi:Family of unknown function (DUF6220)
MRAVYRWWATILFVAVVVQVGFAGYGAFYTAHKLDNHGVVNDDKFNHGFGLHTALGYLIFLGTIVLLILALISRVGRRRVLQSLGLVGLLMLQIVLAWISYNVPAIGFFHPVNALVIFALTGFLASTEWRMRSAAPMTQPAVT